MQQCDANQLVVLVLGRERIRELERDTDLSKAEQCFQILRETDLPPSILYAAFETREKSRRFQNTKS